MLAAPLKSSWRCLFAPPPLPTARVLPSVWCGKGFPPSTDPHGLLGVLGAATLTLFILLRESSSTLFGRGLYGNMVLVVTRQALF